MKDLCLSHVYPNLARLLENNFQQLDHSNRLVQSLSDRMQARSRRLLKQQNSCCETRSLQEVLEELQSEQELR